MKTRLIQLISVYATLTYVDIEQAIAHGDDEAHGVTHNSTTSEAAITAAPPGATSLEIIPNWHPIFVHFSIALLLTASCLFVIAKLAPRTAGWRTVCFTVARWNLSLGMAITLGTVLAGWYAFNTVNHDGHAHMAMLSHRRWAFSTAATFSLLGSWILLGRKREPQVLLVTCLALASGLLLVTAYKGGELVYRHGLGVMALPKADSHNHQH